jgi:hypothetical protein
VAARVVASDPESREAYARGKTDFIERVVALALGMGYPRDLPVQEEPNHRLAAVGAWRDDEALRLKRGR